LPPLAQRFHDVVRIFSGDELAGHAGDIAPQNHTAKPRNNAREAHAGVNHGREAVARIGEIFSEMLDDVAGALERGENIDKAEHLHFEMLIAHRERHHALIKTGRAENGFGMPVDQIENALAALLDLSLQRTHA